MEKTVKTMKHIEKVQRKKTSTYKKKNTKSKSTQTPENTTNTMVNMEKEPAYGEGSRRIHEHTNNGRIYEAERYESE